MRVCKWCGEPLPEYTHGSREYHEGECSHKAKNLRRLCAKHRGFPEEIRTHESFWHLLLSRLNKADPGMMLKDILAPAEWDLMIGMIEVFDAEPTPPPNIKRLTQLVAIGEKVLTMPMDTQWEDVPARIRSRIAWYVDRPMSGWARMQREVLIPQAPKRR